MEHATVKMQERLGKLVNRIQRIMETITVEMKRGDARHVAFSGNQTTLCPLMIAFGDKMKKYIIALLFFTACLIHGESMYLPAESIELSTRAIGKTPACRVIAVVDKEGKRLTKLYISTGKKEFDIPPDSMKGIEFPDLNTIRIETESGMDGKEWFSIVFVPARYNKNSTRYHVSIIDGRFHQVTKSWDTEEGHTKEGVGIINRHFETLYEKK